MKIIENVKSIKIGEIYYQIRFSNDSFVLTADLKRSRIQLWESEFSRQWGDDPIELTDYLEYAPKCPNVFKLKRECIKFMRQMIRAYRPETFCFSANEPEKTKIYQKIARMIAKEFPDYYFYELSPGSFRYYQAINQGNQASA